MVEVQNDGALVESLGQSRVQCLVIPGITATSAGMQAEYGMGPAFERAYGGSENVTILNSAISTDAPDPERFAKIENEIRARLANGPLDIVAHSLGAAELWRVLKKMRNADPGFFADEANKEKLKIVLMGPSGFSKGILRKANYIRNVMSLTTNKGLGLDSMTAFSPEGVTRDELSEGLSNVSNKTEGVTTVPFGGENNQEFLTEGEQAALEALDVELGLSVEKKDKKWTRRLTKERGKTAKEALQRRYEGTPDEVDKKGGLKLGGFSGVRLLARAIGKKPMEEFLRMEQEGFTIDFAVPEFDYVVPIGRIARYYKGREDRMREHVQVIEGNTHSGIALQPDLNAQAIRNRRG